MDHPSILNTMQLGYPTKEHLEHERNFNQVHYQVIEGHPVEDIFGSEIRASDKYFMDANGQAVLLENMRDYLTEVVGVVFYEAN